MMAGKLLMSPCTREQEGEERKAGDTKRQYVKNIWAEGGENVLRGDTMATN